MGSVFIGGGASWATSTAGDTAPYRDYLDANKYLVLVDNIGGFGERAIPILRQLAPETIKNYEA